MARRPDYLGTYPAVLKELAITTQKRGIDLKFTLLLSFATVLDRRHARSVERRSGRRSPTPTVRRKSIISPRSAATAASTTSARRRPSWRCCVGMVPWPHLARSGALSSRRSTITRCRSSAMSWGTWRRPGPSARLRPRTSQLAPHPRPQSQHVQVPRRRPLGPFRAISSSAISLFSSNCRVVQTDFDHIEIRYVPETDDRSVDLSAVTERVRGPCGNPCRCRFAASIRSTARRAASTRNA